MITAKDIMRDADVAQLAGLSTYTFQRKMKAGFAKGEIDWHKAKPMRTGNRRVWLRADVERVINERETI